MSYNESLRLVDDEGDETEAEVYVNDLPGNRVALTVLDEHGDEVGVTFEAHEATRIASMILGAVKAGVRV